MGKMYLGIVLFAGPHVISALWPALRNRLSARLGENAFKGIFSLASLVGLALMIWGIWATRGTDSMVYVPVAGMKHVTMTLVLIGFVLIASNQGKGYIRRWLQHPFSIGIALWSIGHLLSNGRSAALWFFGTMLFLTLLDIGVNMARGEKAVFEPRAKRDGIAVVAGLVAFAIMMLLFHPYVIGVPIAG
ncbi:MAG: NnrU family protein [Alphaproteobacteria bacterium]|nr:NnrU family protein [Alphaproteobacteria bacterium]